MGYRLTVSDLNEQIKHLMEEGFSSVLVEGELSRITFHNSGHIYFTLKDKDSSISCVMFRGNASRLKFRLEEGLQVIISGSITVYKPRGSYQINCLNIEPSGQGSLALAYEQLKEQLNKEGYFASERKKRLPKFVHKVALITSATGAALQDMLRVAQKRYRVLEMYIYDVLVQGEHASFEIAQAIKSADEKGYDIIVVGRGGGSLEDLWAFNEKIVADAIFHAKTPIVSAVGHEIDWMISDFVADLRAPTPSAAMEMILPDTNELYMYIDSLYEQFTQVMMHKLHKNTQQLQHLQDSFEQHSVEKQLQLKLQYVSQLKEQFEKQIDFLLRKKEEEFIQFQRRYPEILDNKLYSLSNQLQHLQTMLQSNHPKYKSKKGFAQTVQDGKIIDIAQLRVGDEFEVQTQNDIVVAKVIQKKEM